MYSRYNMLCLLKNMHVRLVVSERREILEAKLLTRLACWRFLCRIMGNVLFSPVILLLNLINWSWHEIKMGPIYFVRTKREPSRLSLKSKRKWLKLHKKKIRKMYRLVT